MEDLIKLALVRQIAYENLAKAAKQARMERFAQPKSSRRLGVVIVATAILLGMILLLAF